MTHIDLFSGIGGFALAARRTGFRTIAFCEKDEWCWRVLRKHWPDVPIYDDVRTFDGHAFTDATLLTGGFPCQPFSCAGKRKGKEDDRALWPAMLAVIQDARPRWVIGENVPGIISMELDTVLSDLEGAGYTVRPIVLPACATDAPHRRDRVWIVGHAQKRTLRPGLRADEPGRIGRGRYGDDGGEDASDAGSRSRKGKGPGECRRTEPLRWLPEPHVGRVAHGVPRRVDRLRGLGNAIVPQVAEEIMRMIARIEAGHPAPKEEP